MSSVYKSKSPIFLTYSHNSVDRAANRQNVNHFYVETFNNIDLWG